ncbi:hypothetical protein HMF8227_01038 [Saliniradius amylolyticus]|uniref:Sel1 repeat family protein n=1 Tax=Saliniradius amylolyticus TaxID=2183582 RepID=A0A2S2E1L4_9ALTE|nr:sel1 repeat family protein [Saliniradius amylolyticus]AWL11526.1 hypothetical protein HMF8227_01038 [Saliniradius amylolyticus]
MLGWLLSVVKLVIIVGLCVGIAYSTSHYAPQVLYEHRQQPMPTQLFVVARKGSETALEALTEYGTAQSADYWLKLAGGMGDSEAYYQLASRETQPEPHRRWLARAAHEGHARAQYDLAMLSRSTQKQLQWLQQSADQRYVPAIKTLAQWHLLHEAFDTAQPLLEQAAPQDGESGFTLARLLWAQNKQQQAIHWLKRSAELGYALSQRYLALIEKHWQQPINVAQAPAECPMRIQPVATSLTSAYRIQSLLEQFSEDARLASLPMCTLPMVWLEDNALSCSENWQGSGRLGCDEAKLASRLKPLQQQLTHVLVMAEEGKANVHNGVMYLDVADSYSVFVHELAHFVGFVDEYPLADQTAEQVCQASLGAPNVLIQQASESAGMNIPEDWRKAQSDWSLSPARTCDNHDYQAYKLTSRMTFMEFHDIERIPPIYLELWRERLETGQDVIPAYVNFAQALQQKRQWLAADSWWQLAMAFDGNGQSEPAPASEEAASAPE